MEQAVEPQQVKIVLWLLAEKNANNEQAQQFGMQMIEDHQKESQKLQQLASKQGVHLQIRMSDKQKHTERRLLKLSGKAFDKAYMRYMVRDHEEDVKTFERYLQKLEAQAVKQRASAALPVLKEHLQKAKHIASMLGIKELSMQ